MLNGKVQNGDFIVEVENKRTWNVAPQVFPGRSVLPWNTDWDSIGFPAPGDGINGYDGWGYGSERSIGFARTTNSESSNVLIYPLWSEAPVDGFGNVKYTFNHSCDARLWSDLLPTDTPTAGKYYGGTITLTQGVVTMPGNFDYITQPDARVKLWATKKQYSFSPGDADVLIAQSDVINAADGRNSWWPFHPGTRTSQWTLSPVAAFPAGYTHLRIGIEYASSYAAFKEIWLPEHYFGTWTTANPPQLLWWRDILLSKDVVIWEDNFDVQQWVSTTGASMTYDWEAKKITSASTTGIEAAISIPDETNILTDGAILRFHTDYTGAFTASVTGNTTWSKSYLAGSSGWHTEVVPTTAFTDGTCTVKFTSNTVDNVKLYGNISAVDTDGFNYWTYTNYVSEVSEINVNRFDTEVSTCAVVLRTDNDYDINENFAVGKRIRVRSTVLSGTYHDTYGAEGVNPSNTLFTGEIIRREARYPRNARMELKVFAANSFNKLLKEQEYVLSTLDDYRLMVPYMGIATVTESGVTTPELINPNQSWEGVDDYSGLWSLYSKESDIPILDALMITRNSEFGFVWFDRFDRLNLARSMPTDTLTFSDNPGPWDLSYSDIDVSYGTSEVINWITIESLSNSVYLNTDGIFENDTYSEKTILSNEDSIKKYGKAEYKFQTLKKESNGYYDDYYTIKEQVLDRYSNPNITATAIRFPVRSTAEAEVVVQMDLYQLITVEYQAKLNNNYRVNTIRHRIVPGETWIVDIGFGINTDSPLYDASTEV